ncbi:OsmC family protein [Motilibacter deserti]|uniref:OsmC family peroxiredoxin n=1 Tax=Motilibacter deserti TaxID=2714956 RepID=A0ABX0GSS2_9ACTN|nr:OsmC family protein [Motilibacter deserti]NHC12719.1 OsmC family peroxiredoxin [Motilibacter deserti]
MSGTHSYAVDVTWTGNLGSGTSAYRAYSRDCVLQAEGKPPVEASADVAYRGAADRWNPEELLVAALSQCHLLWYLHLCADAGVHVTAYRDGASGTLALTPDGSGAFREVVLRPHVVVASPDSVVTARALHAEAGRMCFLARSMAFPVRHEPTVVAAGPDEQDGQDGPAPAGAGS